MRDIYVSAPGKLHLLGEHAVVYGKPAILAAVNKRCYVKIIPQKERKIEIFLENLKINKIITEKEIIKKTKDAQSKWEKYFKYNNISILKSITSNQFDFPIIIIGETLKYFKKSFPLGCKIFIKSDIPIGSGMGSSAALAVSISGAISLFINNKIDKEDINEIAYLAEQKKHGLPSGGDNATSCFGGLIWYRKEMPDLKIIKKIPSSFNQKLTKNFVAINTGIPDESTGEMVSIVRRLYKKNPNLLDKIFLNQEELTRSIISALNSKEDTLIIHIIKVGEKNLENLGVVSSSTKLLIKEIEGIGGAAKICGAGGLKKATGIVLCYCSNKKNIRKVALSKKFSYFNISLGEEGLRQEKI